MKLPAKLRSGLWVLILTTVVTVQIYLILNQPDSALKVSSKVFLRVPASRELWNIKSVDPPSPPEMNMRVACIIPYIGESLPVWFDAFAFSAQFSAPLFDFLILVTEDLQREVPANVKIIRISTDSLSERIARLSIVEFSRKSFMESKHSISKLIDFFPYVLVEFKPCLGILFADFVESYSYWALADLDILVGSMHKLINRQMLEEYDIYTSSFGDNSRFYLRGQLTIHKNNAYVNNVWRNCDHLSDLNGRLEHFRSSGYKKWGFQSAEGCYSSVAGRQRQKPCDIVLYVMCIK